MRRAGSALARKRAREAVERTLIDLRDRLSPTLVVVTHDRAQARRLSERILELQDGRLLPHLEAVPA